MKNKLTVYLTIAAVLLGVLSVYVYVTKDHTAPVITVSGNPMSYREGDDTSILLDGVTAYDNRDGDISDRVRIYDIAVLDNGYEAVVTYAVYDDSNNIGKASRQIGYVAGRQDVIEEITETQVQGETVSPAVIEETAVSVSDDDADTDNEDADDTVNPEDNGGDNDNDAATVPEDNDNTNTDNEAPVMTLSSHEVHVTAGGDFNPMNYIQSATDDTDGRDDLYKNIHLDGVYDITTAGTYTLTYYCVDTAGHLSNKETLTLVVE